MRTLVSLALSLGLALAAHADVQTLDVAARDGTVLRTDVYVPAKGGPAFPTILIRTPYPRKLVGKEGPKLNDEGYAVVVQDVRGTGESAGVFTGFLDDGSGVNRDGADTVDWILQQPWSNGRVGTVGGSAGANTQALLAPATNKLQCQLLEAGAANFYGELAYPGGVWRPEQTDVWFKQFGERGETARQALRAHPTYDALWASLDSGASAAEITSPGLHIGGWFDIFKEGTLNAFVSRQYRGGPGAKGNQKLIMKWSGHGEYKKDLSLKFPENVFDVKMSRIKERFLAHWLEGDADSADTGPVVRYYVIGDDTRRRAPGMEWRTANRWPPFPPHERSLYLAGDALQDTLPTQAASRTFTYDPAKPCPTVGGCNLTIPFGPYDQRELLSREDVLLFMGPALERPLETTGAVNVKLFVSSAAPDTDFTAKLLDVYPPGDDRHILVLESVRRVKFRNGFDQAAPPLHPGEVVPLEIDLGSTSWIFNKGHRMAVLISSSNYPHFEVNPNTGDDFPNKDTMRPADNTVHTGPAYPSELVIPVRLPKLDSDRDGATDEEEWDKGTDLNDAGSR